MFYNMCLNFISLVLSNKLSVKSDKNEALID